MYSLLPAIVLFLLSFVSALPLTSRDVWAPPVTYPTSSTVWVAGSTYTVTWDTSNQPSQITNPTGTIYLRQSDTSTGEITLTQGFELTAGAVSVTIPASTVPNSDYVIVLYGDSGDWSPDFTIVAPS